MFLSRNSLYVLRLKGSFVARKMISKYTLNTLRYFFLVFEKFLLSPYTWTKRDGIRTKNKNSFLYTIWRFNTVVFFLCRALFISIHVFFISYILTGGERFLAIYVLCVEQVTSQLHISIFRDPERLAISMNTILALNQQQGEKIKGVLAPHKGMGV